MTDVRRAAIIAVVDDDERILGSLELLLGSADHEVRLFDSATARVASGSLAEIDCLISDIAMPAIDGLELMRVAHDVRPELPVILVSGHSDVVDRLPPARSSHCRLFRKPFDGEELLAAVSEALREARPASTAIAIDSRRGWAIFPEGRRRRRSGVATRDSNTDRHSNERVRSQALRMRVPSLR